MYFLYHPKLESQCQSFIKENASIRSLFEKTKPLWQTSNSCFKKVIHELSASFPPNAYDSIFAKDSHQVRLVLALIKYSDKEERKRSISHFDGGCASLALLESAPGLRIGSCEKTLSDAAHCRGTAIFFSGKTLSQSLEKEVGFFLVGMMSGLA